MLQSKILCAMSERVECFFGGQMDDACFGGKCQGGKAGFGSEN